MILQLHGVEKMARDSMGRYIYFVASTPAWRRYLDANLMLQGQFTEIPYMTSCVICLAVGNV